MPRTAQPRSATTWIRRVAAPLVILTALAASLAPAAAAAPSQHRESVIVLPGADSAEGIARGRGATFYAGELFTGDIFRGNVRLGTATKFIDAPEGRNALGMVFDRRHNLLFVAGGATGQGYIYDTRSRQTVASYQFGAAEASLINDVTLTDRGAWFTDSAKPQLYFVPLSKKGKPGTTFKTLQLSGPAAELTGQSQSQWDSRRASRPHLDRRPYSECRSLHGQPQNGGQRIYRRDQCPERRRP